MSLYSDYSEIGKSNIKCSKDQFVKTVTDDGLKNIIANVLQGENIRDVTEFIGRNRMIVSNMALLSLFIESEGLNTNNLDSIFKCILEGLESSTNDTQRTLYFWLLGLTNKGYDNIVRGKENEENIINYTTKFKNTILDSINGLKDEFGEISGTIKLKDKTIDINWEFLSLFLSAIGSQTLTLRGSIKSMNGKLFEKLVLGSLLSMLDFKFCESQPTTINKSEKLFWLSNMDEQERETDATVVFNGKAISIDIGFIGKGNPEVTLDKVSRFGAYKRIGNIDHNMSTIIIVDTVGETSGIFDKASTVNGFIFQMIHKDWIIQVANKVCEILDIQHHLQTISYDMLNSYIHSRLETISLNNFIEKKKKNK